MNDIVCLEGQPDGASSWKDQFVGRVKAFLRIFKAPPPLVTGDRDIDGVRLILSWDFLFQDNPAECGNGNHDKERGRCNDQAHLNHRVAMGLRGNVVGIIAFAHTELPDRKGQCPAHRDEKKESHPKGHIKDIGLVVGDGPKGIQSRLLAGHVEEGTLSAGIQALGN